MSRYKYTGIISDAIVRSLFSVAKENGWEKFPERKQSSEDAFVYLDLKDNCISYCAEECVIADEGEHLELVGFLQLVSNPPLPPKPKHIRLKFCEDLIFEVDENGSIHFLVGPRWHSLSPEQAKQLIAAYQQLNK